jgi:hypothetical protein
VYCQNIYFIGLFAYLLFGFQTWGINSVPSNIDPIGSLTILENLPSGETVDTFQANDPDEGASLSFSLTEGNATFSIDSSGTLKTKGSLNYESAQQHTIRLKVNDEHNASTEKNFVVTVLDMDEGQAPSSGNGTRQDPYKIQTLAHLKWLSYTPSVFYKHFVLANDINATETAIWAKGYGFKPIASSPHWFKGSFDGKGYTISGLTINRPNSNAIGLFGRLQRGTIANLHLKDAKVTGRTNIGILAGSLALATIENCSADGTLQGYKDLGGLIGFSTNKSSISKSKSSGSVIGTKERIGGLVGHNYTNSEITDCYSSSSVTGPKWVGGLVGLNTINSKILRCYSIGRINKEGFAGANHNNGKIADSFWDVESSGQSTSSGTGATGKTTYQMKSLSTFTTVGWNIKASGETWKMIQGITYPLLSWESDPIYIPSEIFFHPGIVIEKQPAGILAGKVHALVSSYQYTPGYGNGDKVLITKDANHMGVSFLRGEELTVTGVGSGGAVNGRTIYRPRVDKGGLWLHVGGKGTWWEAGDSQVSYSLVAGNGSAHNALFSIDTDGNLRTLGALDYESTSSLQVRVRVSKGSLGSIEKALTIPLWDDSNENFYAVAESQEQHTASKPNASSDNQGANSNGNGPNQTTPSNGNGQTGNSDSNQSQLNPVIVSSDGNGTQNSESDTAAKDQQTVVNQANPAKVITRTPVYQIPMVSTLAARNTTNGQWSFRSKVLTYGNFPIFERGFQVSQAISFETFLRLSVPLDSNKTGFTATSRTSEFLHDRVYYYRAYARNAVGANFGAVRKFIPRSHSREVWWGQMPQIQDGWRSSDWFGTFRRQAGVDWIYHAQLGWAYARSDGKQGLWLWTREEGWLWTQPDVFPHLWKHRTANWIYLMGSVNAKPLFHDYATSSIR